MVAAQRYTLAFAVLLAVLLACPVVGMAEEPGGDDVPEEVLSPGEEGKDPLEMWQTEWSRKVSDTATWMDGFFDNDRYQTTSNKSYLRMRLSPVYDHEGMRLSSFIDLRLLLPNTERWLFSIGGDPDKEDSYGSSSMDDRERQDSGRDENNYHVGLAGFLKRKRTRNVGLGGGLAYHDSGVVPYGTFKWVELWEFKNWDLRGTQRFRYFTDTGTESKTTVDIEWPMARRFFFRTSASVMLKDENPVNNYDVDYSLYQFLSTRRALQYQIRTGYTSEPDRGMRLTSTVFEVNYRQQWRDWFSTDVIPQLASYESRNWNVEPGLRIDFNVRFGHVDKYVFKSPFDRKQETNELKAREDRDEALRKAHERFLQMQRDQSP